MAFKEAEKIDLKVSIEKDTVTLKDPRLGTSSFFSLKNSDSLFKLAYEYKENFFPGDKENVLMDFISLDQIPFEGKKQLLLDISKKLAYNENLTIYDMQRYIALKTYTSELRTVYLEDISYNIKDSKIIVQLPNSKKDGFDKYDLSKQLDITNFSEILKSMLFTEDDPLGKKFTKFMNLNEFRAGNKQKLLAAVLSNLTDPLDKDPLGNAKKSIEEHLKTIKGL